MNLVIFKMIVVPIPQVTRIILLASKTSAFSGTLPPVSDICLSWHPSPRLRHLPSVAPSPRVSDICLPWHPPLASQTSAFRGTLPSRLRYLPSVAPSPHVSDIEPIVLFFYDYNILFTFRFP